MSTSRKQWLLKVIAGPHQGAEMGLRAGKLLIGSDDECDVVLHDVLVAPQHVEIETTDAGITAAPLGGRVFINGKRIKDARQAVPDFAFITVGGSHLVVGPETGRWPLLSAADVPELEKDVETPAAAPAGEKKAEEPKAAPEPVPAAPPAVKKNPEPRRGAPVGAFVGVAAGVLLLIGWFVLYQDYLGLRPWDEDARPAAVSKPLDKARAVIADMGLSESVKVTESAGRLSIAGYVDTEAKQRELQAALREAVPGVHTRIYSLEKIASSARALLEDQRLPLTVTSLAEGKLKISGSLASADPWVHMRQMLQRAVPGISGIEDAVEIEAPRPTFLSRSAPEPRKTPKPAKVMVQQPAPAPAQVPLGPVAPKAAEVEPDPLTEYLITADTIDTPESTVATIKPGPPKKESLGFMRLSTGGVYFVGARLPYGGKLARVEENAATIEEKGTSRTLHQGDLVVKPKPSPNAPNPPKSTTAVLP